MIQVGTKVLVESVEPHNWQDPSMRQEEMRLLLGFYKGKVGRVVGYDTLHEDRTLLRVPFTVRFDGAVPIQEMRFRETELRVIADREVEMKVASAGARA